mmetsp:Transcript_137482/g.438776  ORF Transcript_137482/g.438776 Transcript_137482/m.438776 type:complete len:250 (+) Transcript_137482:354-1103(+)
MHFGMDLVQCAVDNFTVLCGPLSGRPQELLHVAQPLHQGGAHLASAAAAPQRRQRIELLRAVPWQTEGVHAVRQRNGRVGRGGRADVDLQELDALLQGGLALLQGGLLCRLVLAVPMQLLEAVARGLLDLVQLPRMCVEGLADGMLDVPKTILQTRVSLHNLTSQQHQLGRGIPGSLLKSVEALFEGALVRLEFRLVICKGELRLRELLHHYPVRLTLLQATVQPIHGGMSGLQLTRMRLGHVLQLALD